MTPERHAYWFRKTHYLSFWIVFGALPGFFISCVLEWEIVAQVIVFSFIPLLFLMRYLPPLYWRL